jgi:hypothetical protein
MNANPAHPLWSGSDTVLARNITDAIADVSDDISRLSADEASALAGGVTAYLAGRPDGQNLHALALSARALAAIGERRLAHRLMLFSSGLVRPASFTALGSGPAWTLDLRRLRLGDRDRIELLLFSTLDLILSSCADMWDASGGHGELCLRNVRETCAALLARPRRHGTVVRLGREIRSRCRYKLGLMQAARRWEASPAVVDLDWWG